MHCVFSRIFEKKVLTAQCHNKKGTDTYFAEHNELLETHYPIGHHIDCAKLDLSKVFDRTWRHKILEQLKMWGFGGRIEAYLQSFLSNRTFKVLILTPSSDLRVHKEWCSSECHFRPTLFLISVESLFRTITHNFTRRS